MKNLYSKILIISIFMVLLLTGTVSAQNNNLGIGTGTPDASAMLEILSSNKGLLVPRMTATERLAIPSPANALLVYDTDSSCFIFYNLSNTEWINLCNAFTETDPIFGSSTAAGITGSDTTAWNNKLDAELDADTTNELQQLSFSGDTIFISNGNFILLPGLSYLSSLIPPAQERLDNGETPFDLINDGISIDSLYGLTYEGGLIAHLDTTTLTGYVVAPNDQSSGTTWNNGSNIVTGASGNLIGQGQANTASIIAAQGVGIYAAYMCDTLTLGGKNDWFLPSLNELDAMYDNLYVNGLGGFSDGPTDSYWSSTEVNAGGAWGQVFNNGFLANSTKASIRSVRAMRSFYSFIPTAQERLDNGETPFDLLNDSIPLDSLYGLTYEGGLIAHLDTTTLTGFVVAPSDQSSGTTWNNGTNIVTGASGNLIGQGQANTASIIAAQGVGIYAAYMCDTLTLGGKNDWFLPSLNELDAMYDNLHVNGLGGFSDGPTDSYWSSTEVNAGGAWGQVFNNGFLANSTKASIRSVRAIRFF